MRTAFFSEHSILKGGTLVDLLNSTRHVLMGQKLGRAYIIIPHSSITPYWATLPPTNFNHVTSQSHASLWVYILNFTAQLVSRNVAHIHNHESITTTQAPQEQAHDFQLFTLRLIPNINTQWTLNIYWLPSVWYSHGLLGGAAEKVIMADKRMDKTCASGEQREKGHGESQEKQQESSEDWNTNLFQLCLNLISAPRISSSYHSKAGQRLDNSGHLNHNHNKDKTLVKASGCPTPNHQQLTEGINCWIHKWNALQQWKWSIYN